VLFPTVTFAIFFMVVLPLNWVLMPRPERWRLFVLAASYFFYGFWDWRYVFLLGGSTLINWILGRAIFQATSRRHQKLLLTLSVVLNLGALGYFKYRDFFLTSVQNTLNSFGLDWAPEIVAIVLPVGISFFTFQALSYTIDIYRGKLEPTTLARFAVFQSFFPHLVAGPIVRASEFLPQLATPRDPRRVDASRAFFLIASGLFLKVVIANYLADRIVDGVFATPEQYGSIAVLIGIYGYAVQIFADFCGYTNMAIGLALLMGFQFPQNFDGPYTAVSLQDFWRRWHMTLSRWLRDYLYIPLGGNRGGRVETYRNLMLVMLIGGLWHGAGWTFVVWGGIHGVGLAIARFREERRQRLGLPPPPDTPWRRGLSRFVTFQIVCLAWVFFRATSFGNAWDVLTQLFTDWGGPVTSVTWGVLLAIAVGIGMQYIPARVNTSAMARFSRLPLVAQGAALGVALMVINTLGPQGVAPFIYFQF
jgi:D-alanyl-lipoteichoic acid acyltransferase DltB (MBOAT superfamily)